ncbi:MAG: amidohydrolase family protein [Pseudomonadota bacterium]|nr:amidohydrolase family protein [Pseudomonadota bacterium]
MTDRTDVVKELGIKEFDRATSTADVLAHADRQKKERGFDDILIIDVDAHHFENTSWERVVEYIEDPVLRHTAQSFARPDGSNPGGLLNAQPGLNFQNVSGRIQHSGGFRYEPIDDKTVHPDVVMAKRAMNAMGIDYQVIFPTPMLQLGLHPNQNMEIELAFAYNRWLTQEVLTGDNGVTTMIYLPFCDADASLKTVKEFADKPGVVGFNITSVRHKPVHHNQFMKVYSAIQETGLPLGFHAGPTWHDQWTSQIDRFIGVHAISFVLCNMVHLTNWVLEGLSERFPNLPVIWIESGLSWVPFMMQRLDSEYFMRSSEAPLLKKAPSEYIREMFFTCQPMETRDTKLLRSTFEAINAETQLLYASDWPHWDFDAPSVIWDLPFIDEEAKKNILGGNANRLFNLAPRAEALAAAE